MSPQSWIENLSLLVLLMGLHFFEENCGEISQQSAILRDAHLLEHGKCLNVWGVAI